MSKTLDYYNENAKTFIQGTVDVEFHETQDKFLALLPKEAKILDFGCGSGRDTKYFLEKGYQVDAIDGSKEMCHLAADYTKIPVKHMLFNELHAIDEYDGIWACSSILHLPKNELKEVFFLIRDALKKDSILYTSFKYGDFEGIRSGRHFTYFMEEDFRRFMQDIAGLAIQEAWISSDVRPGRGDEKWLNLIIKKTL